MPSIISRYSTDPSVQHQENALLFLLLTVVQRLSNSIRLGRYGRGTAGGGKGGATLLESNPFPRPHCPLNPPNSTKLNILNAFTRPYYSDDLIKTTKVHQNGIY